MTANLLVVYEIAYRASKVSTKKAFKEFKAWIKEILEKYQDAAISQAAKIHLIRLEQEYSV